MKERDPGLAGVSSYLKNYARFPVYQNTDVRYFPEAVGALQAMKEDLKNAKHYIFMEYFAIEERKAWEEIFPILIDRVQHGVHVRLFYDDMGSLTFLNRRFTKKMESLGFHCHDFNPFMPGLNVFLNNRDHRKITVIDGRIGYTGGYNLADEYFNYTHPYGYWKDTGVRLEGEAVKSMLVIFLENWNAMKNPKLDDIAGDVRKYLRVAEKAEAKIQEETAPACDGFVQPYGDNPIDNEAVGENVYISLAERAKKYCWFVTPYLIITDEMSHAFSLAAKRGVDVRIITPGIPDKKIVYEVTRSYYNGLARNGVRIFEYTPGFCHAKMCVTDDCAATVGTINLDYRSLYHHFENGCLLMHTPAVMDIKSDFLKMFDASKEVTEYYKTGRSRFLRVGQMILRLFAGML